MRTLLHPPTLRARAGRSALAALKSLAAAAAVSFSLGNPSTAVAQAGQLQELGVVLEGVVTDPAYRQLKADGRLLEVARGEGFVYVEVSPSSAEVTIAKRRGEGPSFMLEQIPSGYQPVSIRAQGYESIDGYVLVEPLKVARVSIVLPPKDGDLTILSDPPGARVLIDGQSVGVAPLTVEKLAGGEHELMLTADGGLVWQGKVLISGGVEVLRPRLRPAEDRAALAATAPVMPPAPAPAPTYRPAPTPAPAPAPVVARPVIAPSAPVTATPPVAPAPAASGEIDLTGLSPQLRAMAWQKLQGKNVEVVLGTGQRARVEVGSVHGESVALMEPGGTARLVPMSHIAKVKE